MNIKQLKDKIKNRKPMSEKKKTLLKGLLFGFLAGGLATITAVGVVGCSMTQGNAKDNEPTHKALSPRFAENYFGGTSWTFANNPNFGTEEFELSFYANDTLFSYFVSGSSQAWYRNVRNQTKLVYDSNGWLEGYQTITLDGEPSNYALNFLQTYATMEGASSSSEETSVEESSGSDAASSSAETSAIDELRPSSAFHFNEANPFSAWAVNPSNLEPAANYDGGAPFILYTGTPSSNSMGTITSKYIVVNVGDFYVNGNPDSVYDAIAITTLTLSNDNAFVINGGSEAQLVGENAYNNGAFIVSNVYYVNTSTLERLSVLRMGFSAATLNGQSVNALSGPAWINVGFRNIVYVGSNPIVEINGYRASALWWLENNALSSSTAVATMILGNSTTGVFGLIASAFSGVSGILGIALIPGITIGTLLFIPLVVVVIFAIIKIINK